MSVYFAGLRTECDEPSGWSTFGRVVGPLVVRLARLDERRVGRDRAVAGEGRVEAIDRDRGARAVARQRERLERTDRDGFRRTRCP